MRLWEAFLNSAKRLSVQEKMRYLIYSIIQTLTNLFDLLGILCFSAASVLFVRGDAGSKVFDRFFPFENRLTSQNLGIQLLFLGVFLLFSKTIMSFVSTYGLFSLLGRFQNRLTVETFKQVQSLDESAIQKFGSTNLSATLVHGSESMALGILGATSIATSEIFLLLILFIPLVIWTPMLASILFLSFGLTSLILHKFIGKWSTEVGSTRFEEFNLARIIISKSASLAKPLKVSGKIDYFADLLNTRIQKASSSSAKSYLLQQIPKYAFELTVILIGSIAGIYLYSLGSIAKGAGAAVLLLGVSFRVLPSLLRLQSSIIFLRTSISESASLHSLLRVLDQVEPTQVKSVQSHERNPPRIEISDVSFKYPGEDKYVFKDLNLTIPSGTIAVIKGKSGTGKTTLIDLILGLKSSNSGLIRFNGESGRFFSQSYMSQDTVLLDSTLEANIALGEKATLIDHKRVGAVIDLLGISEFLPNGPTTEIGASGTGLSGGQKQKIGLARSLYSNPLLMVLDEPTSSLDGESSNLIAKVIESRRGIMTVLIVTHSSDFDEIADSVINL